MATTSAKVLVLNDIGRFSSLGLNSLLCKTGITVVSPPRPPKYLKTVKCPVLVRVP